MILITKKYALGFIFSMRSDFVNRGIFPFNIIGKVVCQIDIFKKKTIVFCILLFNFVNRFTYTNFF